MPEGSPGFVGGRLREARESRQITAVALAEIVGITPASISAYEKGYYTPSPEVFERITSILQFKPAFFLRPTEDEESSAIFERSRSSATKSTRMRARHHRVWLREIVGYLAQFVSLPKPNVPSIATQTYWRGMSDSQIETCARDTRREWGLGDGPISNVTLLAENKGIVVTLIEMKDKDLDAFSVWDQVDNRPYIALGNDEQSAFRTRFNVCHELGHLVLHKNVSAPELSDPKQFKSIELQADRFAAAFLTPATTFSAEIVSPRLDLFRMLKLRWRTSIKMMIHRAHELDIINQEEARRLYINYNRRGWNLREPSDEDVKTEEPRLVRKAFEFVIDNGLVFRPQIATHLPFNIADIEQLANLPHGYLDENSPYMWAIHKLNSGFGGGNRN